MNNILIKVRELAGLYRFIRGNCVEVGGLLLWGEYLLGIGGELGVGGN